jgi:hypothetical protein
MTADGIVTSRLADFPAIIAAFDGYRNPVGLDGHKASGERVAADA